MVSFLDYNVGDRVKLYTEDFPDGDPTGEIVAVNDPEQSPGKCIAVKLDVYHPKAHTCDGLTEQGHGWWVTPESLAKI